MVAVVIMTGVAVVRITCDMGLNASHSQAGLFTKSTATGGTASNTSSKGMPIMDNSCLKQQVVVHQHIVVLIGTIMTAGPTANTAATANNKIYNNSKSTTNKNKTT